MLVVTLIPWELQLLGFLLLSLSTGRLRVQARRLYLYMRLLFYPAHRQYTSHANEHEHRYWQYALNNRKMLSAGCQ